MQVGACLTAFRTGEVVAVSDLSRWRDRWPDDCAAAERVGADAIVRLSLDP